MNRLGRRLACALVVAALAAQAGTANARGLRTGFLDPAAAGALENIPGFPLKNGAAMARVDASGASIVRLYASWRKIAPNQTAPHDPTDPNDSGYTWAELDRQVDAAVARGLDVMLTLRSAPDWAEGKCSQIFASGTCNPNVQAFHDFALAAAKRYSGRVKYWGIWNEPNNPFFLVPQYTKKNGVRRMVSPSRYRALLNAGADAVHSVRKSNLVIGGETSPFGHPETPAPLAFLRKLLCVSNSGKKTCDAPRLKADIWATHPYTSGSPWHHAFGKDDVSFGDLGQWKRLVKGAARSGRFLDASSKVRRSIRLWDTEFSWDTKPPDDDAVPMKLHARWTAEALYRTWNLGIEALLWLQLRDYPVGQGYLYQSGLFRYQNSTTTINRPKLSYKAFRFPFVAYASHGRIKAWGRTPDSNAVKVRIERKKSSGWHLVKRVTATSSGIFTRKWSSGDTRGKYRAKLRNGTTSVPFSLVRPPDRFVNPFGGS